MSPFLKRYAKFYLLFFGAPALYFLIAVLGWVRIYPLSTSKSTLLLVLGLGAPLVISCISLHCCHSQFTLGRKVLVLDAAFTILAVCIAIGCSVATSGGYSMVPLIFAFAIGGQIAIWVWISMTVAIVRYFDPALIGDMTQRRSAD